MKNKTVAGAFALLGGGFGIHRFYLGQVGMGLAYLLFCWTGIPWLVGLIDAIVFLSMDQRKFDTKYNWKYLDRYDRQPDLEDNFERRYTNRDRGNREAYRRADETPRAERRRTEKVYKRAKPEPKKNNPYKQSGVQKFKDYDFAAAIIDFEKALEISPSDVAVHFNLACAYSITEQKEEAFSHLDKAVQGGFTETEKIESHDALAFLRIQDEFVEFRKNKYRLVFQDDLLQKKERESDNLLDQLQKLAELRDKGLLTNDEFIIQKKRLLD